MHSHNPYPGSSPTASLWRCISPLVLAGLLAVMANSALAAEKSANKASSSESDEPKSGRLAEVGSLVEDTHTKISDRFSRFVVQVDDFIGTGESGEQQNSSWARVRVDTVKPGAKAVKLASTVKMHIVLPQSQQRFRLLVSSEDDDSNAANSDAAQREEIASQDNSDVALALRFIRTARNHIRFNYDLGARYKDKKAQMFGRVIVGYKRDGKFGFQHSYTNNFTLFSASGYQNSFRWDVRHILLGREGLFFRNTVELSWKKGNKGAGIGETIGLYADLGKRRAIALEGIAGYATALNDDITDRYRGSEVRVRYRQNLWRPWFYYEIWPSISWSSSNDYKKAYGGLFRIEVTLGKVQ